MTASATLLRMRTVVDAIVDNADGAGTLAVLGADGRAVVSMPWSAVHDRARRMAAVLVAGGIGPGRRVGLLGDTSVDLVAALQAVWLTGAAVTVLPPPSPGGRRGYAENLVAITADADLDLVLVDSQSAAAGTAVAAATAVESLSALVDRARSMAPAVAYRPDPADLAMLQYTSGSTRAPRGVPVTHRHLAANIVAIKAATGHDALHPVRTLSWLPLYHDMGLIGFLALPMSCGCPLFLQSPVGFARRPSGWLEAVSRHRITATGAPNFAYELMTRVLTAGLAVDLSSLRLLMTGGEPVDAATMTAFAAAARLRGFDPSAIVAAYGLAESTLAVTVSRPGSGMRVHEVDAHRLETEGQATPAAPGARTRRLVTLGVAVSGTSVRIVDPRTGDCVGPGTVGHIEVRGPSVVGHYWGEPAPPAGSWLRTGDLGYLTGGSDRTDAELVVCGRAKDVLFAAGRNIFPQDIEAAAAEVPGVRPGGVAAFGIPGQRGDRLVVAVESRGVDPATLRRGVIAAVLDEVGLAPHTVVTLPIGRLPKTSSGKLRRAEARTRYLSGVLSPPTERTMQ
jgi:fatty-acyl-CoA synthase